MEKQYDNVKDSLEGSILWFVEKVKLDLNPEKLLNEHQRNLINTGCKKHIDDY